MAVYFRFIICGLLAMLFMGTARVAGAAELDDNIIESGFYFQQDPAKNHVNRPSWRYNKRQFRHDMRAKNKYRYNRLRRALKSGRIVSLSVIRRHIRHRFQGKIVDVRLLEPQAKNQPYIYIVKLLRQDGRLLVLRINAATARVIRVWGNG